MSIWVGRYAMVAGEVREHGPWLVDRRRTQDDRQVRLLVLAEPVDEGSASVCAEVADAVAALFEQEQLSITGGMLRALRQAHANLAEWNSRSLSEHRVAVGVTCVAIVETTATIAQVGPGAAFVHGAGGLRRLTTEGQPAEHPLGGSEPVEPLFRSVTLERDEQLLLISSEGLEAVGEQAIGEVLEGGPERALADLFLHTRHQHDMTAVLIAELDEERAAAAPLPVDVDFELPHEPRRPARIDSGRAATPSQRRFPLPALRWPRAGGAGARPVPAMRWRSVTLFAAAVLGIVAQGWFALPLLLDEDRGATLEAAVATASLHLAAAAQASAPQASREQLQLALAELARARSIAPDDPRLAALQDEAAGALAMLDAIVEIETLDVLVAFDGVITAPFDARSLTSGGEQLWLLDDAGQRIFSLAADAAGVPRERYRAGERYGAMTAGPPLVFTWDGDGQRLLVLDASLQLFALTASDGPLPLPLRHADELRTPVAIASYSGNLYILDPAAGEVWRYLPAGDGFDSERRGLLGGVAFEGTRGLAVDGDLFVLERTALRHFRLGEELEPMLRGIDRPPGAGIAMVEDVARGRFYIADREGERIIVSDREGRFLRQYRHPQLFDMRALALSHSGERLSVLTGDGIVSFDPARQP